MLEDATEKTISVWLRAENVVEIVCESYQIANNSSYTRDMGIASALGEFFEYQNERQFIRTEEGTIAAENHNHNGRCGNENCLETGLYGVCCQRIGLFFNYGQND